MLPQRFADVKRSLVRDKDALHASWNRLLTEGIERFLKGAFAGAYQQQLLDEFNTYLPEQPSWKVTSA